MYQHKLDAAFFAETTRRNCPPEVRDSDRAGTCAQCPADTLQSLDYFDALSQQSSEEFLGFMRSTSERRDESQVAKN